MTTSDHNPPPSTSQSSSSSSVFINVNSTDLDLHAKQKSRISGQKPESAAPPSYHLQAQHTSQPSSSTHDPNSMLMPGNPQQTSLVLPVYGPHLPNAVEHPLRLPISSKPETPTKLNMCDNGKSQPTLYSFEEESTETSSEEETSEITEPFTDPRSPSQRWCHHFFECPKTFWAKSFSALSYFCVVLTCSLYFYTSDPKLYGQNAYAAIEKINPAVLSLDIFVSVVFLVQYVGRFHAATNKLKFLFNPMNFIDLFSVVGFAHFFARDFVTRSFLQYMRMLKIIRFIKLFELTSFSSVLQIAANTIMDSKEALLILVVYIGILVVLTGALIFYFERGIFSPEHNEWRVNKDGEGFETSKFQSMSLGLWWAMVTLTTTGYGDLVPETLAGRVCSIFVMMAGLTVIALPTSIIGATFSNEWDRYKRLQFRVSMNKRRSLAKDAETDFHQSKSKKIKILTQENENFLRVLDDIQDLLADINPSEYYKKYRMMRRKVEKANCRINKLEGEVLKWKKIAENLSHGHSRPFPTEEDEGGMSKVRSSFEYLRRSLSFRRQQSTAVTVTAQAAHHSHSNLCVAASPQPPSSFNSTASGQTQTSTLMPQRTAVSVSTQTPSCQRHLNTGQDSR